MVNTVYDEKNLKTAERIRASYGEKSATDLEKLRKMDKKVRLPAEIFCGVFGAAGALVLGVGMCLAMAVIGSESMFVPGIIIGIAGIAAMVANYFIYKAMLRSRKRKYSEEIIKLSDKILGNEEN